MGFNGWWHCTKCEARDPGLYKQFCIAYTHKRWKIAHSDHTDHDSDGDYPGHKVREEAYNRMVENHKHFSINKKRLRLSRT
eukprot:14060931-Heterocapsa_arctica.AAC.1